MKKIREKALVLMLAAVMAVLGFAGSARADQYKTDKDWKVTFTSGKKMVSNFKTKNMDDTLTKLQPGDSAKFEIDLKNEYNATTDWYMSNKVLHSLEDQSRNNATSGGAYTYKLVYTDSKKKDTTLFDSETIGGDGEVSPAGEGLHEATDQLEEYFFLDDLKKGQSGKITLEVALDGETQGNDYQDTRADLQMNFAVELPQSTSGSNRRNNNNETTTTVTRTIQEMRDAVRTGDERNMTPYFILGGISGAILLCLGFYTLFLRRKEEEEAVAVTGGEE